MVRQPIAFLVMIFCVLSHQGVRGADILYDTLNESVDINGNFADGVWLGIAFRTTTPGYILDSLVVPIRNPNQLTTGTIEFRIYDSTGPNSLPGNVIGGVLDSRSINGISANSYDQVTLTGLNRTLTSNTNYWIVVSSSGISSPYFIGATSSSGGTTPGSLGYTMSVNLGQDWNAASTTEYAIARIVAVPEPSALILAALGGLAAVSAARNKRTPVST